MKTLTQHIKESKSSETYDLKYFQDQIDTFNLTEKSFKDCFTIASHAFNTYQRSKNSNQIWKNHDNNKKWFIDFIDSEMKLSINMFNIAEKMFINMFEKTSPTEKQYLNLFK